MSPRKVSIGASPRLVWVDAAKSLAIVLIVVYHVSGVASNELTEGRGWVGAVWWAASQALIPVRIPLFFLLAGYLGRRALTRPLRQVVRVKVIDLLWVFLLWSLLFALIIGPLTRPDDPSAGVVASALSIPLGGSAYWFLFALPLYFLVTRLVVGRPLLATGIASAIYFLSPMITAAMAAGGGAELATSTRRLTGFWLFYVVGAVAPKLVDRLATWPWWMALVSSGGFAAVTLLSRAMGASIFTTLLLTALGVTALLVISRLISQIPRTSAPFAAVARATLPIYVTHSFILYSSYLYAERTGAQFPPGIATDIFFTPVLSAALVATALACRWITSRFRLRGIFESPGRRPALRGAPPG